MRSRDRRVALHSLRRLIDVGKPAGMALLGVLLAMMLIITQTRTSNPAAFPFVLWTCTVTWLLLVVLSYRNQRDTLMERYRWESELYSWCVDRFGLPPIPADDGSGPMPHDRMEGLLDVEWHGSYSMIPDAVTIRLGAGMGASDVALLAQHLDALYMHAGGDPGQGYSPVFNGYRGAGNLRMELSAADSPAYRANATMLGVAMLIESIRRTPLPRVATDVEYAMGVISNPASVHVTFGAAPMLDGNDVAMMEDAMNRGRVGRPDGVRWHVSMTSPCVLEARTRPMLER